MKKQNSLLKYILPLAITLSASLSFATERTLNCTIGHKQGTAQIQILNVENHPEITVFKINLEPLVRTKDGSVQQAQLEGVLVGSAHPTGDVAVSGTVFNQTNTPYIINPSDIRIVGDIEPTGVSNLTLYDSNRVIEHGFGVDLDCK